MNNMVFHTILFFHICLLCLQMLSYVPAGVPLYTELSNLSREWAGTPRPDLKTTRDEIKSRGHGQHLYLMSSHDPLVLCQLLGKKVMLKLRRCVWHNLQHRKKHYASLLVGLPNQPQIYRQAI